jgi:hypothetical protein
MNEEETMRHITTVRILSASALAVALSTLPALGETVVEERYNSESYRSGAAAMPTPPPAPERVIEQHKSETTVEQRTVPPPPPPPATVEKRTYEEKVESE